MNIAGIDHRLISSNNHASPIGALPFLLPAVSSSSFQESLLPISSNKLIKYATEHGGRVDESSSMRYSAYQSLLDYRIRNAWVGSIFFRRQLMLTRAPALHTLPRTSELLSSRIPTLRLFNLFKSDRSSLNSTPTTGRSRSGTVEAYACNRHR